MRSDPEAAAEQRRALAGFGFGLAAYLFWGLSPLFWKLLAHVSAGEQLAHRVVWGCGVFVLLARWRGRWPEVVATLRQRRTLLTVTFSGALLALNWLIFLFAILTDRVVQVSLGYFMTPLISVLFGLVFLGERMRLTQWAALVVAMAGVAQYASRSATIPWISLVLAISFAFYGLARKTVRVDALPGSTVETLLMLPLAAGYLAWVAAAGDGVFPGGGIGTVLLLLASGLVTALPLLWFTNAARRLPLYAIGFLQYLAPSLQFVLAVAVFGEPFSTAELAGFGLIWSGLALFAADAWNHRSRLAAPAIAGPRRPSAP